MENLNNRNITLSTKVTAEQKAIFTNIALKHNISLSEWMASLLEIHKDSYDKIGDPTVREIALEDKNRRLEQKIKKLIATLESADHRVKVEMERSDNAVSKRDDAILNLKKLQVEYSKLKAELENLLLQKNVKEKSALIYNKNNNMILPTIGLASIILGLIIGKR